MSFEEKDSISVSLFLRDKGIHESICDIFEGIKFQFMLVIITKACSKLLAIAILYSL